MAATARAERRLYHGKSLFHNRFGRDRGWVLSLRATPLSEGRTADVVRRACAMVPRILQGLPGRFDGPEDDAARR